MSIDWNALMYDPIYSVIGVPGSLAIDSDSYDLVVVDKTFPQQIGSAVETQTVEPNAMVRMAEVTTRGLTADDFDDHTITFNGKDWLIKSHQLVPSPNGMGDGELKLLLEEA